MNNNSTIVRSSLGQFFSLGDLYDAREDAFVGVNIFNQKLPETTITSKDNPNSKVDFETTDLLSQKFRKLDVNAELQLSVLDGLVSLNGNYSSRYQKSGRKTPKLKD